MFGAYDALRDAVVEFERIADGQYVIADFELFRISPVEMRQVLALDFENGQVGKIICADKLGFAEDAAIGKRKFNVVGVSYSDDVVAGDDVAVVANHNPRTRA